MDSTQGILLGTGIFVWFLIPWVITGYHIIRTTIYESRIKLHSGVQALDFTEMFKRIKDRRREDKDYDSMRAKTWKWFFITIAWWTFSFIGLMGTVIIGGTMNQ